jgi:ABC-type lipoprotein release transport system permease subunit
LLYGLKLQDPMTIAFAAILVSAVALPTSFLPARRAAGLEPIAALREE